MKSFINLLDHTIEFNLLVPEEIRKLMIAETIFLLLNVGWANIWKIDEILKF